MTLYSLWWASLVAATLPPHGNTTFNVVYLGRREGPVSAHLYIHTSLGVHKYPVSAVGVASEYDVWPLVGVRVPLNASVEPELTLYNPTDQTIQVSEVYSSGAWLGLRLPSGGDSAPRELWAVPPRCTRPLVRLRLAPPPLHHHPLTAYVRIKANIPGGGLVVAVEARGAPAGEHARPLQLRLRARGSRDPPHTLEVEVANSGGLPIRLEAGVRGARCWPAAAPPAEPLAAPPDAPLDAPPAEPCAAAVPPDTKRANGGGPRGAHVTLLRSQLEPYQDFIKVAELTLDYAELWAGAAGAAGGAAREAWCAGCVRLGRAALPYSVRLLPGALVLSPDRLHFVRAAREGAHEAARRERELRAHNEFAAPLRLDALLLPPDAAQYLHVEDLTPLSLRAGEAAVVARVRLRAAALAPAFATAARLTLRTNLSDYSLPLMVYSGRFDFEWEWPNATHEVLELGAVSADSSLRVRGRLLNTGPVPLCAVALGASLPGAAASLHLHPPPHSNGSTVCVEGGASVAATLQASAPAPAGSWRGEAWVRSEHARTAVALRLRALPGRLLPRPLLLPPAAPYVWSSAELLVENSMSVGMSVVGVRVADGSRAVRWRGAGARLERGLSALGAVTFAPEAACAPACYAGLDLASPVGRRWLQRAARPDAPALADDLALLHERLALFERQAAQPHNFTLLLQTTEVVQTEAPGSARLRWPRLAAPGAGGAGAAAAGGAAALRLLLRNPARAPLLLHALLADRRHLPPLAGGDSSFCEHEECEWAVDAFSLGEWRVTRGRAAAWPGAPEPAAPLNGSALPPLLLQPDAEVELKIVFAPPRPAALTAYLYLRNNLTILEGVQLWGQGAVASFEIGGRRPGSTSPLLFEVAECGEEGAAVVRRSLAVRNTGRVAVRLRDWRVAGRPCAARGFRLQPCAPLHLAPNDSRLLHFSYAADYTLARAHAPLHLLSELGVAEFTLSATTPAKLLPRCAAGARPPWEYSVRAGAWVLSVTAFILVLVAGVIDAERMMRNLQATRSTSPPTRPPLDLRGLGAETTPAPAAEARAPLPRRRRPARRAAPPLDPHAERRAFERWRAEVLRRADDEDDHSSEDAEVEAQRPRRTSFDDRKRRFGDASLAEPHPDSPGLPLGEFEEADASVSRNSADDDSSSSGSDGSTPADERDEIEMDHYEAENEATTREPSPARPDDESSREASDRRQLYTSAVDTQTRVVRNRRDRTESVRHSERNRGDSEMYSRSGPASIKNHGRRDKNSKRRMPAPPTPVRTSPSAAGGEGPTEGATEGAATGEAEGGAGARGGVRWGASWSSVVGGGAGAAPLAPIGSDVRRREPERGAADGSLFYFHGDAPLSATAAARLPDPDFPWSSAASTDRAAFAPAKHDSGFAFGTDSTFATGTPDSAFKTPTHDSKFTTGAHDSAFKTSTVDPAFKIGTHDSVFSGAHDSTFASGSQDSAFGTGTHDSSFTPGTHDSTFTATSHDFLAENGTLGGDSFSALGGVWGGAGSAWSWSSFGAAAPLRPPPGFGAPRSPARPYDPFRSLASIWAPGAADWRPPPRAPHPAHPATPPRPDEEH